MSSTITITLAIPTTGAHARFVSFVHVSLFKSTSNLLFRKNPNGGFIHLINFELTNEIALAEFQPVIYTRHFHCLSYARCIR